MSKAKPKPPAAVDSLSAFEKSLAGKLDQAVNDPDSLEGMHERQGNPVTLGPRIPEAADMAADMVAKAAAAGEKWLKKVLHPKKDPITAAKAAAGKYKNKMEEALRENRFEKGLDMVNEDEMYETITAGGAAPFTSGVQRRAKKVERVMGELRPLQVALAEELDKMPIDTEEQREAKMIAAKRGMQAIGKKRRGG